MLTIAVTGHRPSKLGGYNNDAAHKAIRRHMRDFLATQSYPLVLISGGALGIDQFWMEVGLHLSLPVIAALPFEGYDDRWPAASRQEYKKLLDRCQSVKYICEPGYAASKMQTRNEWMVDNCDLLVAYWNGTPGGTANCVKYARLKERKIVVYNPNEIIK
jgi:uncharacterized phage-like protein YoqJ